MYVIIHIHKHVHTRIHIHIYTYTYTYTYTFTYTYTEFSLKCYCHNSEFHACRRSSGDWGSSATTVLYVACLCLIVGMMSFVLRLVNLMEFCFCVWNFLRRVHFFCSKLSSVSSSLFRLFLLNINCILLIRSGREPLVWLWTKWL